MTVKHVKLNNPRFDTIKRSKNWYRMDKLTIDWMRMFLERNHEKEMKELKVDTEISRLIAQLIGSD